MVFGRSSLSLSGVLAIATLKTGGLSSLDTGGYLSIQCVHPYNMFRTGSSDVHLLCSFFDVIQAQSVDRSFLLLIFLVLKLPAGQSFQKTVSAYQMEYSCVMWLLRSNLQMYRMQTGIRLPPEVSDLMLNAIQIRSKVLKQT